MDNKQVPDNIRELVPLILDLHKELAIAREHLGALRADMRTHIKRTDQVEVELKYLHKHVAMAQGAIALVGVLAAWAKFF